MRKGFTIVEVLVATFLVSVGIMGVFALIGRVASQSSQSLSRLSASFLAREGIEITRNMRDSNLLKLNKGLGGLWTDGLLSCSAGCEIDYNDSSFVSYSGRFLKNNASFYSYDSGTDTKFQRKITITSLNAYTLEVAVDIFWQDKGNAQSVRAATQLFNWYSP